MQRIVLKKEIKTKYPIEGISLVNLEDEIDYKSSNDGMYATGVIKISGEYYKGVRNTRFVDEIDVDIFAPFDDLLSRSELRVSITDFDYKINEDIISFSVMVDIEGLKEVNKSFPSTDIEEEKEEILEETEVVNIDRAGNDNSDLVSEELVEEKVVISEDVQPKKKQIKEETKVCWSFYVVMNNDTYESISSDLNIDINKLKKINKNKDLKDGMLIYLP
ncbi:MAG: hypothetical protein IJV94_02290 [Bacilli bacterium]|nr:hypothetical protein [Bacilli bacterium]